MDKLEWECSYLQRNKKPIDKHGREQDTLNYTDCKFTDHEVSTLAHALSSNSSFSGGIWLANNLITDQGVLDLTRALTAAATPVTVLDLSNNNLKERSGVYLGNYLSIPRNPLIELSIDHCDVGEMGLQRILEALLSNSTLKILKIGQVTEKSVGLVAKYLPEAQHLIHFSLTQSGEWSDATKEQLLEAFDKNTSVRIVDLHTEDTELKEEAENCAHRNKHAYHEQLKREEAQKQVDPKHYAEKIQQYIETSSQNLPIRAYLDNALGTILNDGIYELFKFRSLELVPENHTAVENIKWLVRYIIDHHLKVT